MCLSSVSVGTGNLDYGNVAVSSIVELNAYAWFHSTQC